MRAVLGLAAVAGTLYAVSTSLGTIFEIRKK